MSLIGDALRKARQEAAERDLERKGLLFSAKIADRPVRSNLGLGIAIGAVVAIFATVAGGLVVWWVLGGSRAPEPQSPVAETATGTVTVAEAGSGTESASATATGSAASATDTATDTDSVSVTATDPDTASAADPEPDADPVPDAEPAADPASSVVSEPESGFLGEENGAEIYLMEAEFGAVTLSLDFLVYRETDPYVEINGTELHLGQIIEGFRVETIERDRVRLSDGDRVIVLRTP